MLRSLHIVIDAAARTCTQRNGETCEWFRYGTNTECALFGEPLRVTRGTAQDAAHNGRNGARASRCRSCLAAEKAAEAHRE